VYAKVVVRNKEEKGKKQAKKINNPAWKRYLSTELKLNRKLRRETREQNK